MARQMCQSCGMPLKDRDRGGEVDGTPSGKYCKHCLVDGAFTWPDATAEEMRQMSIKGMTDRRWPLFLAKFLTKNTPKLPRWQKVDTSVP